MKQPKDYIDNCYKNHSNFLTWEGNIPYNKGPGFYGNVLTLSQGINDYVFENLYER